MPLIVLFSLSTYHRAADYKKTVSTILHIHNSKGNESGGCLDSYLLFRRTIVSVNDADSWNDLCVYVYVGNSPGSDVFT